MRQVFDPEQMMMSKSKPNDLNLGRFSYQNAIGPARPNESITLDATFLMASCTKLLTSIAGIQCVERGQIDLDDDVSNVLTELKDAEILVGFEEETGKPILKKAANKITLRWVFLVSATIFSQQSLMAHL